MQIRHRILSNLTELIAAVVIAALIVVVPAPLLAQQKAAPAKPVAAAEEEESASTPSKPGNEGIKVHGHWIIDVKDKDGKVVDHRDFYNSLIDTNLLTMLLTGQAVMNAFSVNVATTGADVFSLYPATTGSQNSYFAGTCTSGAPACNANLAVTTLGSVNGQGPHLTGINLAGQFTSTKAVTVSTVYTAFAACGVAPVPNPGVQYYVNTPAQCAAQSYSNVQGSIYTGNFTGTVVSPLLSVAAGQTVSVNVTLSFS